MTELTQLPGVQTGEVIGVDSNGRPLVRWNESEPLAARAIWSPGAPAWSECIGAQVLIGFAGGDETQPIVLGLLEAPEIRAPNAPPRAETQPETLCIAAGRELVIKCGEATISLRK